MKFLLSVVVAGVVFPYGPQLVAAGRDFLSQIVPDQSEHFLDLAGTTIRAVAQGVIGVAIVQSLLAGIGFKLAGTPARDYWRSWCYCCRSCRSAERSSSCRSLSGSGLTRNSRSRFC